MRTVGFAGSLWYSMVELSQFPFKSEQMFNRLHFMSCSYTNLDFLTDSGDNEPQGNTKYVLKVQFFHFSSTSHYYNDVPRFYLSENR